MWLELSSLTSLFIISEFTHHRRIINYKNFLSVKSSLKVFMTNFNSSESIFQSTCSYQFYSGKFSGTHWHSSKLITKFVLLNSRSLFSNRQVKRWTKFYSAIFYWFVLLKLVTVSFLKQLIPNESASMSTFLWELMSLVNDQRSVYPSYIADFIIYCSKLQGWALRFSSWSISAAIDALCNECWVKKSKWYSHLITTL